MWSFPRINFIMLASLMFLIILQTSRAQISNNTNLTFPEQFQFGVGTSSYQIEGAWNVSDKGESIWDHFTHFSSEISDGTNGDVACDSYHLYERDVEMLVELGVDFYRFSISWPRILPTGFESEPSKDGIDYYNKLINHLLRHNIKPYVTIYHWDLPQMLQNFGGWLNRNIVDYFEKFARVLFENFGDRVDTWTTINEPLLICYEAFGSEANFAPDWILPGVADYVCMHNLILAHARVWHLYNEEFRPAQKGRIGITIYSPWYEPQSNSSKDLDLAYNGMQFSLGWQANPIFSKDGNYPEFMRTKIDQRSNEQGYNKSRLPKFTPEEVEYIKNTYDFFGLNFYTSQILYSNPKRNFTVPSKEDDFGYDSYQNSSWPGAASPWLKSYPPGLRKMLNWIKKEYNDPEILITENGYSSLSGLADRQRVDYYNAHLEQVLLAIKNDNCKVIGYTAWTLMDNFEWTVGYSVRFGLYEVDFKSPNKTRIPRMSALVYKKLLETRTIDFDYLPNVTEPGSSSSLSLSSHGYLLIPALILLFKKEIYNSPFKSIN